MCKKNNINGQEKIKFTGAQKTCKKELKCLREICTPASIGCTDYMSANDGPASRTRSKTKTKAPAQA